MIGISGVARAGKDTLAGCLKEIIEKNLDCEVEIISLAKQLKSDLDKVISCNFNFLVHTDNTDEKNLIRPILVAYGESMKKKWGKDVWLKRLNKSIKGQKSKKFYICADVRFDFEAKYFQDKMDGEIIHITKIGYEAPANDVEAKNDPLVKELSDIVHAWPQYHPDQMEDCKSHANILWQMISEEKKQIWKKTLN